LATSHGLEHHAEFQSERLAVVDHAVIGEQQEFQARSRKRMTQDVEQ
jgi:hypothetical protein